MAVRAARLCKGNFKGRGNCREWGLVEGSRTWGQGKLRYIVGCGCRRLRTHGKRSKELWEGCAERGMELQQCWELDRGSKRE